MRTRFLDFAAQDDVALINERLRGILRSGVYQGYNVAQGSNGGFSLKFTHDIDPDNVSQWLGVIMTPDGVVIREDDQVQDNILLSSGDAQDNVHYIVATYIYNATKPNNDVFYSVVKGTPGDPPTPPSLTDDQVLIAEVFVPSTAGSYGAAGVEFRRSLVTFYNEEGSLDSTEGILKPGVYSGYKVKAGTANDRVTIESGTYLTPEKFRIGESTDLVDIVGAATTPSRGDDALTSIAAGNWRYVWVVAAHKRDGTNPEAKADYFRVEGTIASLNADADPPDDSTIISYINAKDARYTTSDHFEKLALLRVQLDSGGAWPADAEIQYYNEPRKIVPDSLLVLDGRTEYRGLHDAAYIGPEGLLQALDDLTTSVSLMYANNEVHDLRLRVVGHFKMPGGTDVVIPSHVHIDGPCTIEMGTDRRILPGGMILYPTVSGSHMSAVAGSGPPPPAGFARWDVTISGGIPSWLTTLGMEGLKLTGSLNRGDTVRIWQGSEAPSVSYDGHVESVSGDTITIIVESGYAGNTDVGSGIYVLKRGAAMRDVIVSEGTLITSAIEGGFFENLEAKDILTQANARCQFGKITTRGSASGGVNKKTADLFSWTPDAVNIDNLGSNVYDELQSYDGSVDLSWERQSHIQSVWAAQSLVQIIRIGGVNMLADSVIGGVVEIVSEGGVYSLISSLDHTDIGVSGNIADGNIFTRIDNDAVINPGSQNNQILRMDGIATEPTPVTDLSNTNLVWNRTVDTAKNGDGPSVRGQVQSSTAIKGVAGVGIGVMGEAVSTGVYGTAVTQGVFGTASSTVGVQGASVSTGVYGTASVSKGVVAQAPATALEAIASVSTALFASSPLTAIVATAAQDAIRADTPLGYCAGLFPAGTATGLFVTSAVVGTLGAKIEGAMATGLYVTGTMDRGVNIVGNMPSGGLRIGMTNPETIFAQGSNGLMKLGFGSTHLLEVESTNIARGAIFASSQSTAIHAMCASSRAAVFQAGDVKPTIRLVPVIGLPAVIDSVVGDLVVFSAKLYIFDGASWVIVGTQT